MACSFWWSAFAMNLNELAKNTHHYDFFETVRYIQKQWRAADEVHWIGTDSLPSKELVRFKTSQHLGVPSHSVENVHIGPYLIRSHKRVKLQTALFGLTGVNGVLPKHYSELVMQRIKNKDTAMAEFYDLFNHRVLSLFFRAWEKYRVPVAYENKPNGQRKTLDDVMHAFAGGSTSLEAYYGGLFANKIRNAKSLQNILEDLSGSVVSVKQFVGRWLSLREEEQTRLAGRLQPEGQYAALGMGATIGKKVWDTSSAIDIEFHVDSMEKARALLPGMKLFMAVKRISERYLPAGMKVRWRMTAQYGDLPSAVLGNRSPGLGQGAGLQVRSQRLTEQTTITIA
ncbi:type VI secretion system baseplate subunit TssG [Corallincola holothuriorum]|uniref:Type VI secretion system baseplate subunit TssG n=2 Tax=Corallincola holothuriorum TaxID=2282215 RepID=A0A368NQP6_9GAMM|nr:type VI secretion system baseplate subunit TssG [Corallincola holothuriorum]